MSSPLLLVAVALASCSGGSGKKRAVEPPSSTAPAAPVTTSTTVRVDQIPAVITVEYAQRVMDALDKAEGDATRLLYANKVPTKEWLDRITALFHGSGKAV